MRASAGQRELEIVRGQVKNLKGQLHQLQELLATREQEHRFAFCAVKYFCPPPQSEMKLSADLLQLEYILEQMYVVWI